MRDATVGVAMLGAGFIAEYHLAGLAAAGGASVRVVVGRTPDKARAVAARFGVADASSDVDAVLARADVDAVVIATPDDTHEAIATRAARAGKAILLQKPMAGSVAAAERIVAEADRARVDLQVSFMHRFFDEVAEAKRWLDDGALGRITGARIRNATPGPDWGAWFFRRDLVPNGVVDQLGVHGIDLVLHLLGDVRRVNARTRTASPRRRLADGTTIDVDTIDNANAIYTLDDETLVVHEMSMTEAAGCDRFRMEIYGEKGTLWLRSSHGRLAARVPERFGAGWHVPALPDSPPGARQHAVWIAGIIGTAPRLRTADDALRGMRIVEAVVRSGTRGGEEVAIDSTHRTPMAEPAA